MTPQPPPPQMVDWCGKFGVMGSKKFFRGPPKPSWSQMIDWCGKFVGMGEAFLGGPTELRPQVMAVCARVLPTYHRSNLESITTCLANEVWQVRRRQRQIASSSPHLHITNQRSLSAVPGCILRCPQMQPRPLALAPACPYSSCTMLHAILLSPAQDEIAAVRSCTTHTSVTPASPRT